MAEYRPARLHPIHFISCGPTMVGSITGRSEAECVATIRAAAAEDGEQPDQLVDTAFRHQCRAIEILGFDLFSPDGAKIAARDIPRKFTIPADAPTVKELFDCNQSADALACLAHGARPGLSKPEARSCAIQAGEYFDNNVGDALVPKVPKDFENFRVVRYYIARKRADD